MSYLLSPLHSHVLCLRNLSQHFQIVPCHFCREDIDSSSTSMYCCEKCRYHIHTSCATTPRQIRHPRHCHALDLHVPANKYEDFNYRCIEIYRGCYFHLRASIAMKTLWGEKYYCSVLREASDGEARLQLAHEHPLTPFPARTGMHCGGCEMEISEEAYGCSECKFFLHERCANAPLEMQSHPFHLQHPLNLFYDSSSEGICHACRSKCLMGYHCEECELIFHLSCVISTMPFQDDGHGKEDIRRSPSVIDHSLHPHQLSSYHSRFGTMIECQICEHRIRLGDFLGCSDCSFFLHESCAQPPTDSIQRYLHPGHTLTFSKSTKQTEHKCPICEYFLNGDSYRYTCQECDFFIHPACAYATLSELEKGVGMTVQYSFHEHELTLHYDYNSENCTVCNGTIRGKTLGYKCNSQECSFKLHLSCVQKPYILVHPSHSRHPLNLCFRPPNEDLVCRHCSTGISHPFAFSCGECNFYLHLDCAPKLTLKHPFHEHNLFYIKYTVQDVFECSACRKSCNVDFFRCAECNFNLHYDCSQLLQTITSKHHCDSLVLRESFTEDDSGEYYCDICEQRRDPNKWVYFCETCSYKFIAHIECALSPVKLEVIEEHDFIKRKEDIRKREKDIKLAQKQVDAKKASLSPLKAELKSMRAKLESQRVELKEQKIEHAKWINMEVIEEDKPIRGEGDIDTTDGELEMLRTILEELETEQANWLIDFLKSKCNLPTGLFF